MSTGNPATKVGKYWDEVGDFTRPLAPARAEMILADIKRDLPRVNSEMAGSMYDLRGYIHGRLGRSDLALADLRRAEKLLPFDPVRTANIGLSLLLEGETKEAARELIAGLKKVPPGPGRSALMLNSHLATALFSLGLVDEAKQAFQDAEACASSRDGVDEFLLAHGAARMGDAPLTLKYLARFLRLREGEPIDDERASEIVLAAPDPEGPSDLERQVRIHRAFIREQRRLRSGPTAEPSEADAELAEAEVASVLEEMRPLRARANQTATLLGEVEGHGPASA